MVPEARTQSTSGPPRSVLKPWWDLDLPIAHLVRTNDRAAPIESQQTRIHQTKSAFPTLEQCHTRPDPFLGKPDTVVELYQRVSLADGA